MHRFHVIIKTNYEYLIEANDFNVNVNGAIPTVWMCMFIQISELVTSYVHSVQETLTNITNNYRLCIKETLDTFSSSIAGSLVVKYGSPDVYSYL